MKSPGPGSARSKFMFAAFRYWPRLARRFPSPRSRVQHAGQPQTNCGLVIEVFSPLVVGVADHAHDVAAGVERKGPRLAQELNVAEFVQQVIAFSPIAGVTAGNQVFPGRKTSARTRQDVVKR